MKMNECDFTKRVYESTVEGRGVRGRPPVKFSGRGTVSCRRDKEHERGLRHILERKLPPSPTTLLATAFILG